MARILVLEDDPVRALVLEDRLHLAGHRVEVTADAERAASAALEQRVDLLLVKREPPETPGLELVKALRRQVETRALPIIVLSDLQDSSDRVAMLRAGADDYLSWPLDFEELSLRLERLLSLRDVDPPLLYGDLAQHSPWDLLQFLQQSGKGGQLLLRSDTVNGSIQLAGGRSVAARTEHLEGREALLALLGLKEGRFRMLTDDEASGTVVDRSAALPLQEVLLEAAWLEDQITVHRQHLPASGLLLYATGEEAPERDESFEELPIPEVLERIVSRPGLRLFDLIYRCQVAPQKVRLAVAWLVRRGVVGAQRPAPVGLLPDTHEIDSSMLLETTVDSLVAMAAEAGMDSSSLPCMLVAEGAVWDEVEGLLRGSPGLQGRGSWAQLQRQLSAQRSGSASLRTDSGSLSLHIERLQAEAQKRILTTAAISWGVVLWLHGEDETELAHKLVHEVEQHARGPQGIVIAQTPMAQAAAETILNGAERWRVTPHAPRSLLGLLRCYLPRRWL